MATPGRWTRARQWEFCLALAPGVAQRNIVGVALCCRFTLRYFGSGSPRTAR